jgi:Tfp pilus assembly protein PilV
MKRKRPTSHSGQRGVTLIEILVAGVLAAVMISAISAFVAQSSALNRKDLLRRRAFQEMARALEDSAYCANGDPARYNALHIEKDTNFQALLLPNVSCQMTVRRQNRDYTVSGALLTVPAVRITVIAQWYDGQNRTDTLRKIITLVRG